LLDIGEQINSILERYDNPSPYQEALLVEAGIKG